MIISKAEFRVDFKRPNWLRTCQTKTQFNNINIFTKSKQLWITCIKRKKKNGWMREGKKTILDPLQRL